MDAKKLIQLIDIVLLEYEKYDNYWKINSNDYQEWHSSISTDMKVLITLKNELQKHPFDINIRLLRAMHDIRGASIKEFDGWEDHPLFMALEKLGELLWDEIPIYKTLEPLRMEWGKGDPV